MLMLMLLLLLMLMLVLMLIDLKGAVGWISIFDKDRCSADQVFYDSNLSGDIDADTNAYAD